VGNIYQSKDYLIYQFFNSGKPFISIYNKKDKSLISGQKIKFKLYGKELNIELDEEMRIGSLGNGVGYISLPLEGSAFSQIEKLDNLKEGNNPIILLFHKK
jgi:hypothetical protein